jgi:hypothetical protein
VSGQQKEESRLQGKEQKASTLHKIRQIHLRVHEQHEKSQQLYKSRHDQHWEDHKFFVGDKVWLYLCKELLQGSTKKLKPLRYGPFEIIEQVCGNTFKIKLPPCM